MGLYFAVLGRYAGWCHLRVCTVRGKGGIHLLFSVLLVSAFLAMVLIPLWFCFLRDILVLFVYLSGFAISICVFWVCRFSRSGLLFNTVSFFSCVASSRAAFRSDFKADVLVSCLPGSPNS